MSKYKLRNGRSKALFGTTEAAILAGAGISAAASMAGAAMGASAQKDAAKQQADATIKAAKQQADALTRQNQYAKESQEAQQQFIKQENETSRDLQKEIQMNLQMLTAQQNEQDRLAASRIQVRNGGSNRRKLRDNSTTLLRGGYNTTNMPFVVTDGGGVIPIAKTPEGYDLYEIVGNDHEHYHKTQNGKNKTGVGFKFANGGVVEGEGNQNKKQGELLLVTPDDGKFISKHNIAGFNPANAVLAGMNPVDAFNTQEAIKDMKGISDDGKTTRPVEKRRKLRAIGGATSLTGVEMLAANNPNFNTDIVAPTATGIAYLQQQNSNINPNNVNYGTQTIKPVAKYGTSSRRRLAEKGTSSWNWNTFGANLAGAGLSALGNIGGALVTGAANRRAQQYISEANTQAAGLISDAYRQMRGIDLSDIRKSDYSAPHAMAQIRTARVNTAPELAASERALQRRLSNINRGTLSSAAAQNMASRAESDAYDQRSQIYARAAQQEEAIKQGNVERISQVAAENANRDIQANQAYQQAYLNALQYNRDIENQKLAGVAQAQANALTGNAQQAAMAAQSTAQGWGSAMSNIGTTFANTLSGYGKTQADLSSAYLGADTDAQVTAIIASGDKSRARAMYEDFAASNNDKLKDYAARLNRRFKFNTEAKYGTSTNKRFSLKRI